MEKYKLILSTMENNSKDSTKVTSEIPNQMTKRDFLFLIMENTTKEKSKIHRQMVL